MSPKSEHVARELLAIGFRAYPRNLANGFLLALTSVALMWPEVPHELLLAWLCLFALLIPVRLGIARAFLRVPPAATHLARWTNRAAIAYGAGGALWGVLGETALYYGTAEPLYALWTAFLIAFFVVMQGQSTAAHPRVF